MNSLLGVVFVLLAVIAGTLAVLNANVLLGFIALICALIALLAEGKLRI